MKKEHFIEFFFRYKKRNCKLLNDNDTYHCQVFSFMSCSETKVYSNPIEAIEEAKEIVKELKNKPIAYIPTTFLQ